MVIFCICACQLTW